MKEKLRLGEVTIAQIRKYLLESDETPSEVKDKMRRGIITDEDIRSELENMEIPIDQCRHTYFQNAKGELDADDVIFEDKKEKGKEAGKVEMEERENEKEREGEKGKEVIDMREEKDVIRKQKDGLSEGQDIVENLTKLSQLKEQVREEFCELSVLMLYL